MQTVDEMNKYLENNPEHKKMMEDQLMYFFPKWIEETFKLDKLIIKVII